MDALEFQLMFEAEDSHWWYRGMEAISRTVIERYYPKSSTLAILDAGCGTGGNYRFLSTYGNYMGLDISPIALGYCRQRGLPYSVQGSVVQLPFLTGSFDLAVSFDVLSMLDPREEQSTFAELHRVLRPGGRLFLRLPACRWLQGKHDRAVRIRHRYHPSDLKTKLDRSGFTCEFISHANMFLLPLVALKRCSESFLPEQHKSDLSLEWFQSSRFFHALLRKEAQLMVGHSLPFGLTLLAVARKT